MPTVKAETPRDLTKACFLAAGCPPGEAERIAHLMVLSNLRGHDSHGIRQMPRYLENIRKGWIVPGAEITAVTDTPAIALLDGNRAVGHLAAARAAELGIAKAKETKISAVAVRNLDHIGRIGAYPEMAAALPLPPPCPSWRVSNRIWRRHAP